MLSGVININKPPDITSHDTVAQVRRILNTKVGHTGTLDPFATGVLFIAIGPATRLIEYSHDWDKEYLATFTLGATSNTDDITGTISKSQAKISNQISRAKIQKTLPQFVGPIQQTPPAFSAKKVKGKRAYHLARQGTTPMLKPNQVTIHNIQIISYHHPDLTLKITCSTGTYIRSLARDLGQTLGTGALVEQLQRTRLGPHKITDSVKLNQLNQNSLNQHLLPADTLVSHLPRITLPDQHVAQYMNGQKIKSREVTKLIKQLTNTKKTSLSPLAIYTTSTALLGIAHYDPITRLLSPTKTIF